MTKKMSTRRKPRSAIRDRVRRRRGEIRDEVSAEELDLLHRAAAALPDAELVSETELDEYARAVHRPGGSDPELTPSVTTSVGRHVGNRKC